jgi:hypothetical protein
MSTRVQFMQDECRCRCGGREVGRTCSSLGVAFFALERREAEGRAGHGMGPVLSLLGGSSLGRYGYLSVYYYSVWILFLLLLPGGGGGGARFCLDVEQTRNSSSGRSKPRAR